MFIRNVLWTFSTELLVLGGNFLTGILLARGLSVPERGLMALVMALPWTAAGLVNLGLPQASIFLIARKKYQSRPVILALIGLSLLLGAAAILTLLLLKSTILGSFLKDLPEQYYLPLVLLIPLLLMDGILLAYLRVRQRFDLFNLRRLGNSVLLLSGFSAALLILNGGLDAAIWVYITATVVLLALSILLAVREKPAGGNYPKKLAQESLSYGAKSYLQNLAGALNYRLDVYLLAFFLAPEFVAYYAIATAVAEVAWYVPDTVGVVLFPRLSSTSLDEINQITARVCRNTVAFTSAVVAGLALTGWWLVPILYGQAYRASSLPLLILLPGIVAMAVYKILTRNYSSRNRQEVSIAAAFTALGLNVGLNIVLIPALGVPGAALASTLAYTTAGGLMLIFFSRETGLGWQDLLLPRAGELNGHWQWAKMTLRKRVNGMRAS
jgi:O-antigen/teichoic acid export membrane protein